MAAVRSQVRRPLRPCRRGPRRQRADAGVPAVAGLRLPAHQAVPVSFPVQRSLLGTRPVFLRCFPSPTLDSASGCLVMQFPDNCGRVRCPEPATSLRSGWGQYGRAVRCRMLSLGRVSDAGQTFWRCCEVSGQCRLSG